MSEGALTGAVIDGRYHVEQRLGGGGMGEVYRAEQTSLGRPVALKVLHGHIAGSDEMRQRFEREAQVLSRLDHPGVVRVLDFGAHEGMPYLVMDFADGETLSSMLAGGAGLPAAEAVSLLVQLCDALEHAHGVGVIHRDLKPENIVVEAGGRVRILDFGIARLFSDPDDAIPQLTAEGMVVGTPEYLSPEQATGQPLDPRTDLYALGVIAFRMLAGRSPFQGASAAEYLAAHATLDPPSLLDLAPVSTALAEVVHRLLAKRPADRPASAAETRALFEAARAPAPASETTAERAATGTLVGQPPAVAAAAPPAPAAPINLDRDTANLTVAFSEIDGYAERVARLSFKEIARLTALHDALLLPVAEALGGRRVKVVQETSLFTFTSPTRAVQAAAAMQDRLEAFNARAEPELRLPVRIGLSLGEVRLEGDDVFGEPVNVAARIKSLAPVGEVYLSDAVFLSMNRGDCPVEPVGQRTLKGIPEPVTVHRAVTREAPPRFGGEVLASLGLPEILPEDADALLSGPAARFLLAARKRLGIGMTGETPAVSAVAAAPAAVARGVAAAAGGLGPAQRRMLLLAGGAGLAVVLAAALLMGVFARPAPVRDALALIEAGRPDEAVARLEPLVEKSDGEPGMHAALAHAYHRAGRSAKALPHYQWAVEKEPALFDGDLHFGDLLEMARSKHCATRRGAIDLLAALGDVRAVPTLEELAGDGGLLAKLSCGRDRAAAALRSLREPAEP